MDSRKIDNSKNVTSLHTDCQTSSLLSIRNPIVLDVSIFPSRIGPPCTIVHFLTDQPPHPLVTMYFKNWREI